MIDRIEELAENLFDYLKAIDWKQFSLATVLPCIVSMALGAFFFSSTRTEVQTISTEQLGSLYSVQDLPSQIPELQNQQTSILKSQLADLQQTDEDAQKNTDNNSSYNLATTIANVNNGVSLNSFFKALLSVSSTTSVDNAYNTLKPYLAETYSGSEVNEKDTGYQIQQNMYHLLSGNSWLKATNSQTALAGDVTLSIMTGSTSDNRYYQALVPATNQNRDYAMLNYIVKVDKEGKVIACSYTGVMSGYKDINTYYQKVQDLLKNNTTKDEDGNYSEEDNTEDLPQTSTSSSSK